MTLGIRDVFRHTCVQILRGQPLRGPRRSSESTAATDGDRVTIIIITVTSSIPGRPKRALCESGDGLPAELTSWSPAATRQQPGERPKAEPLADSPGRPAGATSRVILYCPRIVWRLTAAVARQAFDRSRPSRFEKWQWHHKRQTNFDTKPMILFFMLFKQMFYPILSRYRLFSIG